MKEARPGDVGDGRANLLAGVNHVHAECVDSIASDIIAIHSRDENLAFVVVHEQTTDHC